MAKLYDGPIIDPHHHLWDLRLGRHAWLAPTARDGGGLGDLAPLRRNYLPQDYLSDARGHNVVATVHVEASWDAGDCLGETRWLEALDKIGGVASRYIAHVPLASVGAPALIEAHAAFPRVAGVRDILSWTEDPAADVRALVHAHAAQGLSAPSLSVLRPAIDSHFSQPTVPGILASLDAEYLSLIHI